MLRAGVASNPFILDQFKTIAMSQLALDVPGATSLPGACSGRESGVQLAHFALLRAIVPALIQARRCRGP